MLELYQFEGCPFCRRVRQALDDLKLDYVIRSVPSSMGERDKVIAISGQPLVPVIVDPENGKVIYDSQRILSYLKEHFRS